MKEVTVLSIYTRETGISAVLDKHDEKKELEVFNFTGARGVALSMYNIDEFIHAFSEASMNTAYQKRWLLYLSTKNTILKKYDGRYQKRLIFRKGPVLLTAPTSVSPGLISSSSALPVASAAADPGASTGLTADQLSPPPPQPLKLTKIQLGLKRKSGVQQLNVSPQTRFKVDVNAQENRLSGCAVICDGISVVVVEGGHKSINRYGKVMLKRIIWASAVKEENEDEDESDDKPPNKCVLVWQGNVAKIC
ncbi:isocitrate dehydrogenase [nadp] [Quercus suber]|uniref:Isocitrate dehydrogenase [nadp] n=1 Tax=Quercus suber TaxID=58331 RepID=A0AAW0LR31_QUESU